MLQSDKRLFDWSMTPAALVAEFVQEPRLN
jgi:hypothetical protein